MCKVRFRLTESSNYGGLLYRGVGRNLHKSHLQSGGRFYADCPEDASQYGVIVQVVKLSNDASIFNGNSSYKFCKDNGLMDVEYDILSAITYGECSTLRCVDEEFLDDGTDNIHYRAFQCVACEELREQGYDGAEWEFEDELTPHQFQIWNADVLINCGTLRSVWENGKERFIAESLVESATEVDSQGNELTSEQISFFRNSKVRDSNGNLLVVYHGTPHKFDTFDKTKVGSRFTYLMGGGYRPQYTLGFYFTDDKHYASTVGNDGLRNIIKECYLNIENPLVLNVSGWGGSVAYADICHNDIKRWSVGYDGIIINHYDEDDKGFLEDRVIIAFEPNQIKSITTKSPTESDNLNEKAVSNKDVVSTLSKSYKKYMRKVRELTIPEAREYILSKYDDEDIQKIVDFVNSLSFPLKVYRGLQSYGKSFSVNLDKPGRHWTVDTKLFTSSNSIFKNATHILCGYVDEDDVDWEHTIDTFANYSLRPAYNVYPEMEITLKKNAVPKGLTEISKDSLNEVVK